MLHKKQEDVTDVLFRIINENVQIFKDIINNSGKIGSIKHSRRSSPGFCIETVRSRITRVHSMNALAGWIPFFTLKMALILANIIALKDASDIA